MLAAVQGTPCSVTFVTALLAFGIHESKQGAMIEPLAAPGEKTVRSPVTSTLTRQQFETLQLFPNTDFSGFFHPIPEGLGYRV